MELIDEYIQEMISLGADELCLEPNKNPYVVSSQGNNDLADTPLVGSQINMAVFCIIPEEVKQELLNRSEVNFVHSNALGSFDFSVKKSPDGFNVKICRANGKKADPEESITDEMQRQFETSQENSQSEADEIMAESESSVVTNQVPVTDSFQPEVETYDEAISIVEEKEISFNAEDDSNPVQSKPSLPKTDPATESQEARYQPENTPMESQPETNTVGIELETFTPQQTPAAMPVKTTATDGNMDFLPSVEDPGAASNTVVNLKATATMDKLFKKMAEIGASDLHLSVSVPPFIRKDGKMQKLEEEDAVLTPESAKELLTSIMPQKNLNEFSERHDTDFAYEIPGLARFRANIFMDRKGMGGVFRVIPSDIMTAEDLKLSEHILELCNLSKGLVVVTGPTGSGKSTTLCAMVDYINKRREDHIITIEDPIEFTHENNKCLVNQREVHNHTDSFKDALRAALREDPDILLVGEMRDLETVSIAIETAETGHLVFATLHTTTAASTVDRIIDQFPADRQQQVRVMLSESLRGVIAQTLLPRKGGGRVAALEVLIVTPAISNLIREGKTFQIPSAMQTGKSKGMVMLNDALMELVKKGTVEPRDAYIKAVDKISFETLLSSNGIKM